MKDRGTSYSWEYREFLPLRVGHVHFKAKVLAVQGGSDRDEREVIYSGLCTQHYPN
jgi:hypothetical protein